MSVMGEDKYSYSYVDDGRYTFPGTDVLRNKLGIKDSKALSEAERTYTSLRLQNLLSKPMPGSLDFEHLKAIHKYIFQDIYEWAGKERTVAIAKTDLFCLPSFIDSYASDVFSKLKKDNYLRGLSNNEFLAKVTALLSDINALHPFREGNGRTQREFIRYVAGLSGYGFDYSLIGQKENIVASHESINGNETSLRALLERSLYELEPDEMSLIKNSMKI